MMDQNNIYLWDIDNPLGYKNKMGYYKTKIEYEFISCNLKHDNLRILDVGGGSGRFAIPLAERGHNVTIIDKSAPAMECLKKRDNGRIKFICDDFMECTIDENYYDVVIAMESVLYFNEMEKLFIKINRALLSGGIFIFSESNEHSWRYYIHKKLRNEMNYNVKSAKDYTFTLNLTGFEVYDIEGFMWMPLEVNSDSALVNLFAYIESRLGLHKWVNQSPWLLLAAHKRLRI